MTPWTAGVEIVSSAARFDADRGANHTSQFGEDGLIKAALWQWGVVNQWCFEVGAADGLFFSNTVRLRERGWFAVLVEADEKNYADLATRASDRVQTVHQKIGRDSLDSILAECGAPEDLDLGVIDIDGQDYWAWEGMRKFRPRLMLVEFDYGSDDKPDFVPELGAKGQASRKAIERLGREKGYEPVARTHCNLLFARSDL